MLEAKLCFCYYLGAKVMVSNHTDFIRLECLDFFEEVTREIMERRKLILTIWDSN